MVVPFAARMRRMALTMVVLPTPGPPVMTSTLDISASWIAATWLSAKGQDRYAPRTPRQRTLSGSIQGQGSVPFASRISRSAMVRALPDASPPEMHMVFRQPGRRPPCPRPVRSGWPFVFLTGVSVAVAQGGACLLVVIGASGSASLLTASVLLQRIVSKWAPGVHSLCSFPLAVATMQGQTATRYGVETSCRRAAIAPMMPANQSGAERLRERIVAERRQPSPQQGASAGAERNQDKRRPLAGPKITPSAAAPAAVSRTKRASEIGGRCWMAASRARASSNPIALLHRQGRLIRRRCRSFPYLLTNQLADHEFVVVRQVDPVRQDIQLAHEVVDSSSRPGELLVVEIVARVAKTIVLRVVEV